MIAEPLLDVEVDHAGSRIDVVGEPPRPGGQLQQEPLGHRVRVWVVGSAQAPVAIGGRGAGCERDGERGVVTGR